MKAKEQEYKRIQHQINELEQAKRDISFQVQKKLDEAQEIAEYLDGLEFEATLPEPPPKQTPPEQQP